jgi:hypothetical protein
LAKYFDLQTKMLVLGETIVRKNILPILAALDPAFPNHQPTGLLLSETLRPSLRGRPLLQTRRAVWHLWSLQRIRGQNQRIQAETVWQIQLEPRVTDWSGRERARLTKAERIVQWTAIKIIKARRPRSTLQATDRVAPKVTLPQNKKGPKHRLIVPAIPAPWTPAIKKQKQPAIDTTARLLVPTQRN